MRTSKKIITVNVENISAYCSIGIHDEEKKMGQELLIDASFEADLSRAVESDNVKDTLNYVDVYKGIQKIAKSKSYSLIETLADEIVETFLKHPQILKAKIKIKKPHVPFPDFHGDVSVEIER
ncbi:MAG: dihydroneopterin aldolase [Candidatus Melainabacteria bacterium RIFCSPHIGHO2_02_FULL_34_12]|nr:MAG: dihydroneopterin aldolase [Candidatus Melainabacteria bacterium RIFCSPHIGHO2_02_FULL_34_12]